MGQKSIGLYNDEDKESWEEASELAKKDMEEDGYDDPSNGEILAYICRAYTGYL